MGILDDIPNPCKESNMNLMFKSLFADAEPCSHQHEGPSADDKEGIVRNDETIIKSLKCKNTDHNHDEKSSNDGNPVNRISRTNESTYGFQF